jgi:hypothetical protein
MAGFIFVLDLPRNHAIISLAVRLFANGSPAT